ncbi:hypothetical protein JCM16418_4257 [Paenibacillus pini JCM 16418]|uniref:Uncharacterized protein n=1 Tax=Paenibacillus pini JCM 16418 TaxID=1236976 RepID=W7YSA5_9BACL|nr:hypothetical protein JCM16418_4257 [Paenibacillus pini JCM 16418]
MREKKPRTVLMSKWTKTKVLLGSKMARPFIPDTRRFNKSTLRMMLNSYSMVYVKPEVGTFGNGVIRVEQIKSGGYTYQLETKVSKFKDYDSLHSSLQQITRKKSYLIQKGIHLVKYNKRCFDIRVMVQLSPKGNGKQQG